MSTTKQTTEAPRRPTAAGYAAFRAEWQTALAKHREKAAENDGRQSDFSFGSAGAIEMMLAELEEISKPEAA